MRASAQRRAASVLLVALLAWLAGCGSNPSSASPPETTDTDSGVLSPNNVNVNSFTTSASGNVTITLVTLNPPVTAVGVGLGVVSNGSCTIQYTNTSFTTGTVWQTSVNSAGLYCVAIYDIGYLVQNTNYTITIMHP
jgi:hypothetical protein